MMAGVSVKDVVVEYPLLQSSRHFVSSSLAAGLVGGLLRVSGHERYVRALDGLSLELAPGDRVGLVGHNGSGKTTFLRLLAGILTPTEGEITVEGSVVPLLDKGLGLSELLTAEENVELPMRLLGASSEAVAAATPGILAFTELGDFVHLPMRMYSAGMRARLAFAICTAVRGDVLLLDEWMGAGDIGFVEKATRRIDEMVQESRIMVLASHSLDLLTSVCNRVLWFDHGRIVKDGDPTEVSQAYWEHARRQQLEALGVTKN